jgi:hypothetical protein
MDARLGHVGADGLAADGVDVLGRRDPPHTLGLSSPLSTTAAMFGLAMAMSHDVGAAAKPHHQEDDHRPNKEVEKRVHDPVRG